MTGILAVSLATKKIALIVVLVAIALFALTFVAVIIKNTINKRNYDTAEIPDFEEIEISEQVEVETEVKTLFAIKEK